MTEEQFWNQFDEAQALLDDLRQSLRDRQERIERLAAEVLERYPLL